MQQQQQPEDEDGQEQQQHSDVEQELMEGIRPSLNELQNIWEYIGYTEADRSAKLQQLADSLQQHLLEAISQENAHRVQLEADIESRKRKAAQICHSLRQPPHFPPRGLPSLQLLRHLDGHIAQFQRQVAERQERFSRLTEEIGELCESLDADAAAETAALPTAGPRPDEFVPTEAQLDSLQQKQQQLLRRRDAALEAARTFRDDIRRIAGDIEYLPENDFEAKVLADGADVQVKLSEQTLSELQSWRLKLVKHKAMLVGTCDELREQAVGMWRRLGIPQQEQSDFLRLHAGYRPSDMAALREEADKCEQLKRQQLPAYAANLRREVRELAASCFDEDEEDVADDADDAAADDDVDDEVTEEVVSELERRVEELRERRERNRELYDAVQQYQLMWAAFLDVEQRMRDPGIFSNRGGILLKTEKERKQLAKELPKAEARAAEQLRRLGGDGLRIRGRTFQQHVQHLWDQFRNEKEAAKVSRKQQQQLTRTATTDEGNAPASPRRSVAGRPR